LSQRGALDERYALVVHATRALGVDLYQRVREQAGNLLVSPYSVWMALAMLVPGARGKTLEALGAVLGITDVEPVKTLGRALAAREEMTPHQKSMVEAGYLKGSFGFHLDVANKLWVQHGYRIRPAYAQALADGFGVDPAPVDFAGAPDAACDAINRWVNDRTRGKIKDIISPTAMVPALRALLANAIYFKAGWADEFNERGTQPLPFKLLDGSTATVPLMWRTAWYGHAEVDGVTAIQLPYIQPDVAMVVLAPKAGAFADVERTLTVGVLDKIVGALAVKMVDLKIPKFKFSTSLSLGAPLRAIGLAPVMQGAADLSGISEEPGFGVGEVLHKTFIAVDEKGTEAAAVTAVALAGSAMPPKPVQVVIDRPFYVLIRDIPTGTALFFGRVVDPR
jgi:serpin B